MANHVRFGVTSTQFEDHHFCHEKEVNKLIASDKYADCNKELKKEKSKNMMH